MGSTVTACPACPGDTIGECHGTFFNKSMLCVVLHRVLEVQILHVTTMAESLRAGVAVQQLDPAHAAIASLAVRCMRWAYMCI